MSAERGLAKIMADPDTREWLYELLGRGGLWNSEYYETPTLNDGRLAIWSFVSKKVLEPIREHHHDEFLTMQREARTRLETQRIEAARREREKEKAGRQPRTP